MLMLLWCLSMLGTVYSLEYNIFEYSLPHQCSNNQSFNPITLSCKNCPAGSERAEDGVSCKCLPGYYIVQDTGFYTGEQRNNRQGGLGLSCKKCGDNLVASRDQRMCLECATGIDEDKKSCKPCPKGSIQVERDQQGQLLGKITCVPCSPGSQPDPNGLTCIPCLHVPLLPDLNVAPDCNCSPIQDGLCLPQNLDIADIFMETPAAYSIKYGDRDFDSKYFKDHITVASYMCGRHLNSTACNQLANLCTLTLHSRDHPACLTMKRVADRNNDQSVRRAPQLFLPDGQSSSTLESESILSEHSLRGRPSSDAKEGSHRLNISVARYSMDGKLLDVGLAKGNVFHLCNVSEVESDAAWTFGVRYKKTCRLPGVHLWSVPTVFYDLYVPYTVNADLEDEAVRKKMMYSVFNLILNNDRNVKEKDAKNWELTKRFFLVDRVGAVSGIDPRAKVVRYLESMELDITLLNTRRNPNKPGRIHPPVLKLRYKELTWDEANKGEEVEMTFSVSYSMSMRIAEKDVEIAVGVMSALAVILSAVEALSWSRRSGKVAVDLRSLAKLIVAAAGNLAHVFLAVVFFSSLYWFIFFKQQTAVHAVLPSPSQEHFIKSYVISAFSLKLLDIVVLIVSQVTVDIFLLDWERPPPGKYQSEDGSEAPVSVWRTYLVANEWNELQTRRKTSTSLQVILFLIVIKVIGVENLASADPFSLLAPEAGQFMAEPSYICRFTLGVSVWAGLAMLQAIFWVYIYPAVVEDKLAQFTDICTLSNISVFIMSHAHFGYYIHGKSPHGSSDTNMAGLMGQLQREADDLCGHRGLQAGSDHQTYSMTLPLTIRSYYDKIVAPASQSRSGRGGREAGRLTGTVLVNMVQAYTTMNKFLTRFLEHALKDLDYEVREKSIMENILDIEFQDTSTSDKAIFYADKGSSFASVLLYDHEFSLTVWEVLVLSFVDLLAEDFLLAAIITYFAAKLVSLLRYNLGRANLATKTLIDKRFLI